MLSVDLADLATGYNNVGVDEQETDLARNGIIHKYRLDRYGGHIGTHEYIRPKPFGGFHIEGLHTQEVRSVPGLALVAPAMGRRPAVRAPQAHPWERPQLNRCTPFRGGFKTW